MGQGRSWSLLKAPERQSISQLEGLGEVSLANRRLFRAFLLKEELRLLYHLDDPALAPEHLAAWLAWASRSKLKPFVKLARTIRRHREGILSAIRLGLSNGRLEGLRFDIEPLVPGLLVGSSATLLDLLGRVSVLPQARHLEQLPPRRPAVLALDGHQVEARDLALALDSHRVTLRQWLDQLANPVAQMEREVWGRGAHELAHVLDRRLSVHAVGSLELAHGCLT